MSKYIPKTNVLIALKNILSQGINTMPIVKDHKNNNRINSAGDLLEYYIKDSFCGGSTHMETTSEKLREYQKVFSYLGNASNPPDFAIQHGPAVEVKKIQGEGSNGIALNSSFPKDSLYSDDFRIKQECRECEDEFGGWSKKDMIYAVGNVKNNVLHSLWLVYGDCYCADKSYYERISKTIRDGVANISDVEFGETKELGRINKVDPLGITYMRIRGMWVIDHPSTVFRPWLHTDKSRTNIYVLMTRKSYDDIEDKPELENLIEQGVLTVEDVQIPNPNNPAKNLAAILYTGKI